MDGATAVRTNRDWYREIQAATDIVRTRLGEADVAVVLGSGLQGFSTQLENQDVLVYDEIPNFPRPSVAGHAGKLVRGMIGSKRVLCFAGRVHAYEGHTADQLAFSVVLAKSLGAKLFIATNASGGCQKGMEPGCIMSIVDFMNLHHSNPLCRLGLGGWKAGKGNGSIPFPSSVFSKRCEDMVEEISRDVGIPYHRGVYCWTTGPSYETGAEVAAGLRMQASAFGMSTVPEIMTTAAMGMEFCGMAIITNVAAGILEKELSHEEVQNCAAAAGPKFQQVVKTLIERINLVETSSNDIDALSLLDSKESFLLTDPPRELPTVEEVSELTSAFSTLLDTCVNALKVTSHSIPKAAIITDEDHADELLDGLQDPRNIEIEIRSSRKIEENEELTFAKDSVSVTVGSSGGRAYLVIVMPPPSGFDKLESCIIARALAAAGVGSVFTVLTALSTTLTNASPKAVQLQDAAFLSSSLPLSTPASSIPYSQGEEGVSELFLTGENSDGNEMEKATLACFEGPSMATVAEIETAARAECQATTDCLLYPAFEARCCGLKSYGFASIGSFLPTRVLREDSKRVVEVMKEAAKQKAAEIAKAVFAVPLAPYSASEDIKEEEATQWSNIAPPPVTHEYFHALRERVQGVVRSIAEPLAISSIEFSEVPVLMVSRGESRSVVDAAQEVEASILFRDLPLLNEYAASIIVNFVTKEGQEKLEPQIALLRFPNGLRTIAFLGLTSLGSGVCAERLSLPVRFAAEMGARKIFTIARGVLSAPPQNEEGDKSDYAEAYVVVRDHIATTGRSPLFGPNDNLWGPRFPDMSFPYDKREGNVLATLLRKDHHSRTEEERREVIEGVAGWVSGGSSLTRALVKRATVLGADVVCACGVAEVITARHMGLTVTSLLRADSPFSQRGRPTAPAYDRLGYILAKQ